MSTFEMDQSGMAHLFSPGGDVGRWLARKGGEVALDARRTSPFDTGLMWSKTYSRVAVPPLRAEIVADTYYATFVHQGTKAHPIRARRAQMLRFPGRAGEIVYRKSVNHPGTKPRPWLREALVRVVGRG
jgi:hypothetical protein